MRGLLAIFYKFQLSNLEVFKGLSYAYQARKIDKVKHQIKSIKVFFIIFGFKVKKY